MLRTLTRPQSWADGPVYRHHNTFNQSPEEWYRRRRVRHSSWGLNTNSHLRLDDAHKYIWPYSPTSLLVSISTIWPTYHTRFPLKTNWSGQTRQVDKAVCLGHSGRKNLQSQIHMKEINCISFKPWKRACTVTRTRAFVRTLPPCG